MTYAEKLKSPMWQRKRLEILQRDNFTCRCCGESEKTLHVHHRYYEKGREPWNYPGEALVTLCRVCHEHESERLEMMARIISRNDNASSILTSLAEALCDDLDPNTGRITGFLGAIDSAIRLVKSARSMEDADELEATLDIARKTLSDAFTSISLLVRQCGREGK